MKTSLIILLLCIAAVFCAPSDSDKMKEIRKLPEVHGEKFYYFGFGSNMLTKRIHIQNPTAVKIGPGKLEVSWRKREKSGDKKKGSKYWFLSLILGFVAIFVIKISGN